jgi:hypothetical protein
VRAIEPNWPITDRHVIFISDFTLAWEPIVSAVEEELANVAEGASASLFHEEVALTASHLERLHNVAEGAINAYGGAAAGITGAAVVKEVVRRHGGIRMPRGRESYAQSRMRRRRAYLARSRASRAAAVTRARAGPSTRKVVSRSYSTSIAPRIRNYKDL